MYNSGHIANHFHQQIRILGDTFIIEHEIADEMFYLFYNKNSNTFYFTHPVWNTKGAGFTPIDAEIDLIQNGKELYEKIKDEDIFDYSFEKMKMRDWCMRVYYYNIPDKVIN